MKLTITRREDQSLIVTKSILDAISLPMKLNKTIINGDLCTDEYLIDYNDGSYRRMISDTFLTDKFSNMTHTVTIDPDNLDDTSEYCLNKYPQIPSGKKVLLVDRLMLNDFNGLKLAKEYDKLITLGAWTSELNDDVLSYCENNDCELVCTYGIIIRSRLNRQYRIRKFYAYQLFRRILEPLDLSFVEEFAFFNEVSDPNINFSVIYDIFSKMTNLKKLRIKGSFFIDNFEAILNTNVTHLVIKCLTSKYSDDFCRLIRRIKNELGCLVEIVVRFEMKDSELSKLSDVVAIYDPVNTTYDATQLVDGQTATLIYPTLRLQFMITSKSNKKSARK